MIALAQMTEAHVHALGEQKDITGEDLGDRASFLLQHVDDNPGLAILASGRVIAVVGLREIWPGRGVVWYLFSAAASTHAVLLKRVFERYLDMTIVPRVELYMDVDEATMPGRRWAELLGFKLETETPLEGFSPEGKAIYLYSRMSRGRQMIEVAGLSGLGAGLAPVGCRLH